jgi:hypothetical protein
LWVCSANLLNRNDLPWCIWVSKHLPHDVPKLKLIASPFGNASMFIRFSDFTAIFYVREIQNLALVFGNDKYVLTISAGYRDLPEWNTHHIEQGSVPRVKNSHFGLKKTLHFIPPRSSPSIHMRFNVRAKRATTAGRQARACDNVRSTAGPGLVACRWRSA